jgi:hypothetical protein
MKRILIAALLAGVAMFLWEFVAHMVTPLGEAGFRVVPNEANFVASMKAQIPDEGLYLFPAPDQTGMQPKGVFSGILVAHPNGMGELTPRQLGMQFVVDVLVMALAGWLLSKSRVKGVLARAGLVTALALIPALQVHVPYWNWYGFPLSFTLAAIVVQVVGFFAGGLVLAKWGPREV